MKHISITPVVFGAMQKTVAHSMTWSLSTERFLQRLQQPAEKT